MRTLGLLFAVMAIAGCRTTGVFEAPGHIEKVGDAYYGYIGESNECYIVQYRLTAEDMLKQDRLHQDFFFTNFVSKADLLWTLETNLVSFARCDGEVEIVKGVLMDMRTGTICSSATAGRSRSFGKVGKASLPAWGQLIGLAGASGKIGWEMQS